MAALHSSGGIGRRTTTRLPVPAGLILQKDHGRSVVDDAAELGHLAAEVLLHLPLPGRVDRGSNEAGHPSAFVPDR
jgi:hypothetical protein